MPAALASVLGALGCFVLIGLWVTPDRPTSPPQPLSDSYPLLGGKPSANSWFTKATFKRSLSDPELDVSADPELLSQGLSKETLTVLEKNGGILSPELAATLSASQIEALHKKAYEQRFSDDRAVATILSWLLLLPSLVLLFGRETTSCGQCNFSTSARVRLVRGLVRFLKAPFKQRDSVN